MARDLIGKFLVRRLGPGRLIRAMITETEAYVGAHDLACHARHGKTRRNQSLWLAGGHFYVYMAYGLHQMLNVVTGDRHCPQGVLIRSAGEFKGPGVLTRNLQIGSEWNGRPAARPTGLWFEDRGVRMGRRGIRRTPRIGIAYSGPAWSMKPLRFVLCEKTKKEASNKARLRVEI